MPSLKFTVTNGDKTQHVEVSQIFGAGDDWHITIDNYNYGTIQKWKEGYVYMNDRLDINDVQGIVDRITEFLGEPRATAHIHYNDWGDKRREMERKWLEGK